jgi:hypothetical protein
LIADAGTTVSGCEGTPITIGGSPTASGGTGPYTYVWDPAAGLNSSGDANPVATLTTTTDFTVTITDAHNCAAQATTTVGINALPTPVIVLNGSMLSTSGGVSYQWYVDGTLIPTAVNSDWTPLVIGDYTVAVTDASGCVGTSAPYTVTTVGIRSLDSENGFVVYPNPASQSLHVKTVASYLGSSVHVYDVAGQEVLQTILSENDQVISLENIAKGMYTLVLDNGSEKKMTRFAVTK